MMNQASFSEITKLVDDTISKISGRELVSSSEMTDLLLDIRLYLIQLEESALVYES